MDHSAVSIVVSVMWWWRNICLTLATICLFLIAYHLERIAVTLDQLVLPPYPGIG